MKVLSFLGACGLVALTLPNTHAATGKGKSGYCNDDTDCTKKAKGYVCVSVQTTRDNVEQVKQCLPTTQPICAGLNPGLCPSFSTTWGPEFRQISSVCAYIYPEGKNIKCLGQTSGSSSGSAAASTNSTKGGVECLSVPDPDTKKNIGVIYGCVDFDGTRLLFDKKSKSEPLSDKFEYKSAITDNCVNPKNPSGSTFVCSSQGTCAPQSATSMDYECKCNVGFSGKYCEKIDDNKCYYDGVCGGGTCDLDKQECSACKDGTTGPKCAECVPGAANVCGGHGTCVAVDSISSTGASSSNSSSSSSTTPSKTTVAPSKTPNASSGTNSTSSSGSKADESVSPSPNPGTVGPDGGSGGSESTITRFLATTTGNQCKCDEGYTDIHCGVKSKTKSNSSSSVTPQPSSSSVLSMSISAVFVATVALVGAF